MTSLSELYFGDHISNAIPVPQLLPFTHVCDAFTFRNIFHDHAIKPRHCEVFDKELVYFFYGKPAFKVSNDTNSSQMMALNPVCFVIDAEKVTGICAIYPFDSGAFKNGLFTNYVHKKSKIDDFAIKPNLDSLKKFIGYFYHSNTSYYDGVVKLTNSEVPSMSYEIEFIHSIFSAQRPEKFDERCQVVEVQSSNEIRLENQYVKAIVVPGTLMDNPRLASFILSNDIDYITYDVGRATPQQLSGVISEKVKTFYETKGFI